MSKTFALSGTTSYIDPFAEPVAPALASSTTYVTCVSGSLDVPDGVTAGAVYSIPMGPITILRALRLINSSTQELDVKYNSVTASYGIPSSGVELKVFPSDASNAITAIDLVTTDATGVGDGTIDYVLCGT